MLNLKPVQATLVLGQPGLRRMTGGWGGGRGRAGREGRRVEFTECAQKWPKQKASSQTKSHRMTCNAYVSLFPRMPNKIQDT